MAEPDELAPPSSVPAGSRSGITCEFCECGLSGKGEVIKRSAKARSYLDLEDRASDQAAALEQLRAEVAALQGQLTDAKRALDASERKLTAITW